MNKAMMDRLLKKWRVMIVLVLLFLAVWRLHPWSGLNLELGFDIVGGSRIILRPSNQSVPLEEIIGVVQNRLNVYGLSDIKVRAATDLESSLIVVEAAGLSSQDVEDLLASQGYFEGKINNVTIFTGDDVRVDQTKLVLRKDSSTGAYMYSIPVMLTPEAAKKFAEVTESLFPTGQGGAYLDKPLDLYIDGKLIDSLQISSDLRGREVPSAQVTGGAETRAEAIDKQNKMVAILMTGSIPTKLNVESIQKVSPVLGSEFLRSTAIAGLVAALLVAVVLYLRYRNLDIVGSILFMSVTELVLTLALASFMKRYWQFDLSAIAGLVIAIGTGVDQEIIMTDEFRKGGGKRKRKEAMFVIMATFGTMFAAMLPLLSIGAGAVRGFAITTIIGIVVGYLITRPSYIAVLEEIL
jgi:preprotein translocase subunit SecD